MLQVELGLLSDGGVRIEGGLDTIPQAGNIHGRECWSRFVCGVSAIGRELRGSVR